MKWRIMIISQHTGLLAGPPCCHAVKALHLFLLIRLNFIFHLERMVLGWVLIKKNKQKQRHIINYSENQFMMISLELYTI